MMVAEQIVLIAGASGTLGEAVTRTFRDEGARLGLLARRLEPLRALMDRLGLTDDEAICCQADLSRPQEAGDAVRAITDRWGRVDCLLNLVGTWGGGVKLADLSDEVWHAMIATNLHTAFNISRAVIPPMIAQGGGRIIHIGSRAVERLGGGQAPYNVSKAGLVALTRSIAVDYGAQGIRANVILPSTIVAERSADEARDRVAAEDLARVMLMLCGPTGEAVNGAAIPVYGGRVI
ncbi:MAG: SDR family NAD(P)-dependent oxidoreductase [Chloroflexi bacterium]|nr:SDR family NAD(P)-dependent oxidoreductase [Chloroflexota bacterium]